MPTPRWFTDTDEGHSTWYRDRFRDLEAEGADLEGEARFVDALAPRPGGGAGPRAAGDPAGVPGRGRRRAQRRSTLRAAALAANWPSCTRTMTTAIAVHVTHGSN